MCSEADVIIIGAGAAGLSAAKELARLGVSFQLIEGADRIGGRASSVQMGPDDWFDQGCAWLVDGETNPFTPIARRLKFELSTDRRDKFQLENLRFVRDGRALSESERKDCIAYCKSSDAAIDAAAQAGRDVALGVLIAPDDAAAQPFLTSVDISWGAGVDHVSSVDSSSCEGTLGYQVYRGFGSLVAAWGADVPVALDTRAERIEWSGKSVSVETNRGSLQGKAVLVTVSNGVLAAGKLTFHPALPGWKQDAVNALPMGVENKIGLYFEQDVFEPEDRAYHTVWRSCGEAAKVDASVMGGQTASVLVGGEIARKLERDGPEAMQNFAEERLADIFGNGIRRKVARRVSTAWEGDPLIRGAWAYATPGNAQKRADLARQVDDRVFFAGEATMVGSQGTCHGAYEAGQRAAQEIAIVFGNGKIANPGDGEVLT